MDRSNETQLFNTNANDISMPSIKNELSDDDKVLISDSIDSAILNKQVKTLILPEQTDISKLNYILDFTDLKRINRMQREAIQSLLSKDGDVHIYLYTRQKGLFSVGFGSKYTLERLVPILKKFVFDDELPIYKNFEVGKELIEVESKDITQMRLNL